MSKNNTVKFRPLDFETFAERYEGGEEGDEDSPEGVGQVYGEVKIPGHGWRGCRLGEIGQPTHFWDEDDGWQTVPNVSFEKV